MRIDRTTISRLIQYQTQSLGQDPAAARDLFTRGRISGADSAAFSPAALRLADQTVAGPTIDEGVAAKLSAALKDRAPELFAKLDADQDGRVSGREFSAVLKPAAPESTVPRIVLPKLSEARATGLGKSWQRSDRALFTALDADHNGSLASAEVAHGGDRIAAYFQQKVSDRLGDLRV